jgi:hypothetical protein
MQIHPEPKSTVTAYTQQAHTKCWAAHTAYTAATLTCCFKTALLLSKIIAVIRSSHKRRVTDGDKLAGKKTAMHRYLKKRHANTSNLRKPNDFIWEVYKEKKLTPSNI